MKIICTKHAKKKFTDLSNLGIKVNKTKIENIIKNPVSLDRRADPPNTIVSGVLDQDHFLRVVYRQENGIIIVITFYPARKGRY